MVDIERRLADVALLEVDHEDRAGGGLVAGAAAGHLPDDRERVEDVDDVDQRRHHDRRPQQRQRHPQVGLPRGRAVDRGRLVHVARDALQAGQEGVGGERQRDEDRDPHHPQQRAGRVAEPVRLVGAEVLDHADVVQDHVDDADVRVQRPLEDQRGHHHRGGPRDDQRPPGDPAAGELLVEQLGQAERDQHGDGDHDHDPDHGAHQDGNEALARRTACGSWRCRYSRPRSQCR